MATIAQPGAACAQVLATSELLEAILLEADPRTILLAQRVDSTFQACIKNSPTLQELLFLRTPRVKPLETEDNPIIFESPDPSAQVKRRYLFPSPTLRNIGLVNGFSFRQQYGDSVVKATFYELDLERYEKDLQSTIPSILNMHLRRGGEERLKIEVRRPDYAKGNWNTLRI